MAQKTGESTGLKAAESIKAEKPKFHKPKTEGIRLNSGKQEKLYNELLKAIGEGNNEKINRLMKAGADVNHKNKYGRTALMLAAGLGQTETCKLLLEKGADIHAKDNQRHTVLEYAEYSRKEGLVKLLKEVIAKHE
jgi:ankyrin repeat protein